jgi:hypothetical protein
MKAADTVWVAAALLQRERGRDADMSVAEIVDRAAELNGASRSTLQTMASQHLVATARPSPDKYRMLTAVGRGRRRLYRPGDPVDPGRLDSPTHPEIGSLPAGYRELVDWYRSELAPGLDEDPMEELVRYARESGVWRGIDADQFVAELRAGWE